LGDLRDKRDERTERQNEKNLEKHHVSQGFLDPQSSRGFLEAPGIEPGASMPQGEITTQVAASPSFPMAHSLARESQIDSDLDRLIDAWPTLPPALKAGILAMIDATRK
jgi:hypothetical protein